MQVLRQTYLLFIVALGSSNNLWLSNSNSLVTYRKVVNDVEALVFSTLPLQVVVSVLLKILLIPIRDSRCWCCRFLKAFVVSASCCFVPTNSVLITFFCILYLIKWQSTSVFCSFGIHRICSYLLCNSDITTEFLRLLLYQTKFTYQPAYPDCFCNSNSHASIFNFCRWSRHCRLLFYLPRNHWFPQLYTITSDRLLC